METSQSFENVQLQNLIGTDCAQCGEIAQVRRDLIDDDARHPENANLRFFVREDVAQEVEEDAAVFNVVDSRSELVEIPARWELPAELANDITHVEILFQDRQLPGTDFKVQLLQACAETLSCKYYNKILIFIEIIINQCKMHSNRKYHKKMVNLT